MQANSQLWIVVGIVAILVIVGLLLYKGRQNFYPMTSPTTYSSPAPTSTETPSPSSQATNSPSPTATASPKSSATTSTTNIKINLQTTSDSPSPSASSF